MNSVCAASIPDSTGAPEVRRRHTRSTGISGITLLSTLSTVLLVVSCGGRIELIPLPQIGHLSDDAVMASDSGVRVMVRSDAWPGDVIALPGIVPLEITIDNRSGRSLRIGHVHFALVQNGNRITAMAPTDAERLAAIRPVPKDIVERALPNGILDADERVRGFVYFPPIDESDEVTLVVDLVDSSTASPFGAMGFHSRPSDRISKVDGAVTFASARTENVATVVIARTSVPLRKRGVVAAVVFGDRLLHFRGEAADVMCDIPEPLQRRTRLPVSRVPLPAHRHQLEPPYRGNRPSVPVTQDRGSGGSHSQQGSQNPCRACDATIKQDAWSDGRRLTHSSGISRVSQ